MMARPGFRAAPAVKPAPKMAAFRPRQPAPKHVIAPRPAPPPPRITLKQAIVRAQQQAAQRAAVEAQQRRLQATQAAEQRAQQQANQAAEKKVQDARQQQANAKADAQKAQQANAAAQAQQNAAKANDAKQAQQAGQNAGQNAGQAAGQNAGQAGQNAGQAAQQPGQAAAGAQEKAKEAAKGAIDQAKAKIQEAAGKAIDDAVAKMADKLPGPLKGMAGELAAKAKAGLGDLAKGGAGDLKAMAKDGGAKLQEAVNKAIQDAAGKLADQVAGKLPGPLGDLARQALAKGAEALKAEVGKAIADGMARLLGKDGLPGGGGLPGIGQGLPGVGVKPPGGAAGPAPAGGPKQGQLIKMSIKPEKGEKLDVQYNPAEYTVVKSTPWKHHDINGLDAPALEFTSGEPVRLHFELVFDTFEPGTNVRVETDKLEKFAHVHQELHRPPVLLLAWGKGLMFKCVLERFNVRYTMFLETGVPVRAVANCVFKEFAPREEQLRGAPRHSPDRTKRRILREGETLSGIAAREYEDPTQWRLIADANGIDDPLTVRPGTELRIPPFIRHR